MRPQPLLWLLFAPLLITGCAALTKGTDDKVALAVPEQTEIRNYTAYRESFGIGRRDSLPILKIRGDQNYLLELAVGDERDSVMLTSSVAPGYLIADIFLGFPITLPVDLTTGAIYTFDRDRVVFPSSYDTTAAILSIYDLADFGYVPEGYRVGDLGLLVGGHFGFRSDLDNLTIYGNDVGLFAGYRLNESLYLTAHYNRIFSLELAADEDRDNRREPGSLARYALGARYHITPTLYGSAEVALLDLDGDDIIRRRSNLGWFRINNSSYNAMTTAVSLGLGATFHGIFIEYRRELTIPPFAIDAGQAGSWDRTLWHGMVWFGGQVGL